MHRNRRARIEQTALRLSLAGTLVAAAAGFYFGIHLGSNAILLDGIFSLLSLGILCGFLLGAFLERQGYDQWTPYIDPALTSLISLFAVMLPIRVLRANISEVLLRAPEDSYQQRVDELVTEIEANYPIQESEWYLAKTGRRYDLEINFLVAQGTFETMKEQDELRNYIWNRLKQRGVEVWLTVSFTAQEKWL